MAPQAVTFPERRFVLTKIENDVETNVAISVALADGYTSDQIVRATSLSNARSLRDLNPGIVYLLYGPTNGGPHTDGDLIWRSDMLP